MNLDTLPVSRTDALRRWPRLIAHLVSESFACLSVMEAADLILAHRNAKPFSCKWYDRLVLFRTGSSSADEATLLKIARDALTWTFLRRHHHKRHRYHRSEYAKAVAAVKALRWPGF